MMLSPFMLSFESLYRKPIEKFKNILCGSKFELKFMHDEFRIKADYGKHDASNAGSHLST